MLKKFIEWTEGDISRGRKVVLFATIFAYLNVTTIIVISGLIWPTIITSGLTNIFTILTGLMFGIYGFYTGTSSDKTKKLADKAADIILSKLDNYND